MTAKDTCDQGRSSHRPSSLQPPSPRHRPRHRYLRRRRHRRRPRRRRYLSRHISIAVATSVATSPSPSPSGRLQRRRRRQRRGHGLGGGGEGDCVGGAGRGRQWLGGGNKGGGLREGARCLSSRDSPRMRLLTSKNDSRFRMSGNGVPTQSKRRAMTRAALSRPQRTPPINLLYRHHPLYSQEKAGGCASAHDTASPLLMREFERLVAPLIGMQQVGVLVIISDN